MAYSKISSVELINFMSFKRAKIAFDDSGIINIKGYNDSGKSAILRGIAVCLMDMFRHKQLKFIRHDEEYFRIVVSFEDGISIVRDKYANGQSLYEMYRGSELLFTTKQGNRLTKIEGVPEVITNYLGLCITDNFYLNYQSCVDKLPVVDTTGSENYQMFHEILKMEEIFYANNMINTDKNDMKLEIYTIEYQLQWDEILYERCGDVSEDFIKVIEGLDRDSIITNNKLGNLDSMVGLYNNYSSIPDIPKIAEINASRLKDITNIVGILDRLNSIVDYPKIEFIDSSRLVLLNKILGYEEEIDSIEDIPKVSAIDINRLSMIEKLNTLFNRVSSEQSIPSIRKIDLENILDLGKLLKVAKGYAEAEFELDSINTEIMEVDSKLKSIITKAKEQGINIMKCSNCGSYSIPEI